MGKDGWCILCVENQRDVCQLIAIFLQTLGYEVVTAHTFSDGLAKALFGSFDLYIIDSDLPDGTGAELCKQIRLIDRSAAIVFSSAGEYHQELAESINASANYFLSKPFQLSELENITALLFTRRASRANHSPLMTFAASI